MAGQGCILIIFMEWVCADKWISSENAISALKGKVAPEADCEEHANTEGASIQGLGSIRGPARPVRGAACELVAHVASSCQNSCQHVMHAVHIFPQTGSSRGRPHLSSQPAEINHCIQNSTCYRPKADEVDFRDSHKPLKEIMHEFLSWSSRLFEVLLFVELVAVIIRV